MWFRSRKWSVYPVCEDAVLYCVPYDMCKEAEIADAYEGCGGREVAVDELLYETCPSASDPLFLPPSVL